MDPATEEFTRTAAALVREKPEILYPLCAGSASAGFDALPPELQTPELREETQIAGRRYCDVAIGEGYVDLSRAPTTAEVKRDIERIYREHPELTTPTCVLAAMTVYESQPLVIEDVEVTPARAEEYFSRICIEAATSGVFGAFALEPTPAQQRQIEAIAARVLDEMIAAGELP